MLRKIVTIAAFMFLMAITIPVFAQRYNSCDTRGRGRDNRDSYNRRYDRDNYRNYGQYRRNNNNRNNRRYNNGGYYNTGYSQPYYTPQTYYVVRRPRPVRRYNNYGYRPRYRNNNRSRISFSIGF